MYWRHTRSPQRSPSLLTRCILPLAPSRSRHPARGDLASAHLASEPSYMIHMRPACLDSRDHPSAPRTQQRSCATLEDINEAWTLWVLCLPSNLLCGLILERFSAKVASSRHLLGYQLSLDLLKGSNVDHEDTVWQRGMVLRLRILSDPR